MGGVAGLLCRLEQGTIRQADRIGATLFAEKNPLFLARYYRVAWR